MNSIIILNSQHLDSDLFGILRDGGVFMPTRLFHRSSQLDEATDCLLRVQANAR